MLFIRPIGDGHSDDRFLTTLAYALKRAIQTTYEVEEREVDAELIGEGSHRRIMLWEAAEGGIGIWERLLESEDGFAQLGREALNICHFDPETGSDKPEWAGRCGPACYDCLLSFSNQLEHRLIDRGLVRDFLIRLVGSHLVSTQGGRPREEQYAWLMERTDPASSFERDFLRFLYERGLRLPDLAQHRPVADLPVQTDFYYERPAIPGVCVFVDGPHHDAPDQAARDREVREELAHLGFRVIAIHHSRPIGDQVSEHPDVFR